MLKTVAIAVVVMLALTVAAAPARAQGGGELRIATANAGRIFKDMQETKDLQEKVNAELQNLQSEQTARQQKITELKQARDLLKVGTPQYDEANRKLTQAAVETEVWGKMAQAELQRTQKAQIKMLYDKVTAAIGEVAQQREIQLVLATEQIDLENLDSMTSQQLSARLSQRDVLYSAASVDISDDVLAVLDRKYKGKK
jgi:Skp family chaperone for outer membrane proteins